MYIDGSRLPFDFRIKIRSGGWVKLEFDGSQHFQPHSFSPAERSEDVKRYNHEAIQRRDRKKDLHCATNRISLLRMDQIPSVESAIRRFVDEVAAGKFVIAFTNKKRYTDNDTLGLLAKMEREGEIVIEDWTN